MDFPTNLHQEYIEYLRMECNKYGLSLLLEGSLAKKQGKRFSDIDLAICGNITTDILDRLISGYDTLVMSNYTENPKGIMILNYENGINVDLDIRETFLQNEIDSNVILLNNGFVVDDILKRKVINSKLLPPRQQWYKTLRLIHRCCIKYLCHKEDTAQGLCEEVKESIYDLYNISLNEGTINNQMQEALKIINGRETVNVAINVLFDNLFINME